MKIRIFQAGKGDCILVTSSDGGTNILADGGVFDAYEDHFASALARMRRDGRKLDVLYVSHIDRDHIGGVLRMLDNEVAWRVFEARERMRPRPRRNRRPAVGRPCEVKSIWHNAFFEDENLNTPSVVNALGQAGAALAAHRDPEVLRLADRLSDLGTSVGDAIEVSRRIGRSQLGIPLNPPFRGGFMLRKRRPRTIRVGPIRAHILGPTKASLEGLIDDWNEWLGSKAAHLRRLLARHARDADALAQSDANGVLEMLRARASDLASDRGDVTPPNLASLMFLFEENGKRALFTGDGAWEDVIDGLAAHRLLDADGCIHVDLLKVPHHGAHNSYDDEFARRVTADHYVFSGNGEHHNPEPDVVQGYIAARRAGAHVAGANGPERHPIHATARNRSFKLWFNCSEQEADEDHTRFWRDMEVAVRREASRRGARPRLRFRFLKSASMTKTL